MSSAGSRRIDRSTPPSAGPTLRFRFPDFESHRLTNGLTVYLCQAPRAPLVYQLLLFPGGAQLDEPSQAGLSALTASMMDEGSDQHTALQLASRVESLGGYLTSQADWDSMSASVGVLARHQRDALRLLAEVARRAVYPEHEFSRLQSHHLAELRRRQARPSVQASDQLARLLYDGTIYGEPLLGTATSLGRLQRDDVLAVAGARITPRGASLVLVGHLDPGEALAMAEETFADWVGEPIPLPPEIEPVPLDGLRIRVVDRPGAPQTELWVGQPGLPGNHPDWPGLTVLNSLLGGKFTSRINLNLRERLGITYGASSTFTQRCGPGPFVVTTSVDTEAVATALREILGELTRLQQEPVTAAELDDTRSYLLGIFPFTLQRIEGLADRLADLALFDLPADYFDSFLAAVATVTVEELQRLARKHLDPTRIAAVAVGPRDALEGQLEHLQPARIDVVETPSDGSASGA